MKVTVIVERGTDGSFGVYTDNYKGCTLHGSGSSVEEAKASMLALRDELVAMHTEEGNTAVAKELQGLTFVYKYDIASVFDYYKTINISAFAKSYRFNKSLLHQYRSGQYVSDKRIKEIQQAINELGRELSSVTLV